MPLAINSMKLATESNHLKNMNHQRTLHVSGAMKLHGQSVDQSMALFVTRTGPDTVKVTSKKPYVFDIQKFDMTKPLKKMM